MKIVKKILATVCTATILLTVSSVGCLAASAETKKFLDPYDNSSFPLAYKVNITLPDNYDVKLDVIKSNGGVFGMSNDKRALAAFKTNKTMSLFKEFYGDSFNRTQTLLKNYVAVDLELIYKFDNGFKDFEFMGIAGAGFWAGAYGKDTTIQFAYSDSASGGWQTYDYESIREMPAEQDSTYCYFKSSDVPISARYLRVKFLNGADWDATNNKWVPYYANWDCALGYMLVDQYTTPQSTSGATSSSMTSSGKSSTGTTVIGGTSPEEGDSSIESDTASSIESDTASSITDENIADVTDEELANQLLNNGDYCVVTSREIDWKVTWIIIAADAMAVGGAIAVLILLYSRKLKLLGLTEQDTDIK